MDRLPPPQRSDDGLWGNTSRSYNIGISERGQAVLEALGAMSCVRACSTPLIHRSQWTPEKPEGEVQDRREERDAHTRHTLARPSLPQCPYI
jgi:2-polyprenyl-6-methoxyphenol hydroxylase-like FAD-dependent oxidoreductase